MLRILTNSFYKGFCSQTYKLRISNLNFNATESDVQQFFSQFSTVKEVKIVKHISGNSKGRLIKKGFGYVTVNDQKSYDEALNQNQKEFQGRQIMIHQAMSKEEYQDHIQKQLETNPEFKQNYDEKKNKRIQQIKRQVFMRNINFNATEQDIREFVQDCGEVERIFMPQTGNLTRGFCYIHFKDEESAQRALEKSGQSLLGRSVQINEVKDKKVSE